MNHKKGLELLTLLLSIIPLIYLSVIYPQLPEQVPIHFNMKGEADSFASKTMLWVLIGSLTIGVYLLMKYIPYLDSKSKKNLEENYPQFRLVMSAFMSALAIVIIRSIQVGSMEIGLEQVLAVLLSLLLISFAKFFPKLKQNYFIGIRTPWTLKKESVWIKTHRFSGKLSLFLGFIALGLAFILPSTYKIITAVGIILIWAFYSIYYSYQIYQKEA